MKCEEKKFESPLVTAGTYILYFQWHCILLRVLYIISLENKRMQTGRAMSLLDCVIDVRIIFRFSKWVLATYKYLVHEYVVFGIWLYIRVSVTYYVNITCL